MTPDPIELARLELTATTTPTEGAVETQRSRMDAVVAATSTSSARGAQRRRRWIPASGVAVAAVAITALIAPALLPTGSPRADDGGGKSRPSLRLITGAGAFAGIDLETASAADVL
ncbi:MAG: hypothetical protein JWM86_2370, partial [Thermoleophilia bacterium]|nr:hypothetical protein [Thermoleophilia bacterium]